MADSTNQVSSTDDQSTHLLNAQQRSNRVTLGAPVATGKLAVIENTYASAYNHAIDCF